LVFVWDWEFGIWNFNPATAGFGSNYAGVGYNSVPPDEGSRRKLPSLDWSVMLDDR
jgi:hypothetical protein